jgi:hypothetical protein
MSFIKTHLESRHYDYNLHSTFFSEDDAEAFFLLYNLSGQIVGYQKYNPLLPKFGSNDPKLSKYYTWKTKIENKTMVGLWGLESWNFTNTLFVCEGVFDAARLTSRGASAVATLSNDLSPPFKALFKLFRTMRPVVALTDSDDAGSKLAKAGHTSYSTKNSKDMGDASEDEVSYVIEKFSNL